MTVKLQVLNGKVIHETPDNYILISAAVRGRESRPKGNQSSLTATAGERGSDSSTRGSEGEHPWDTGTPHQGACGSAFQGSGRHSRRNS